MKLLKKILSAVGALALACSTAFASVAIDATHFPNPAFRSYISTNFDENADGTLSDAEIAGIHEINLTVADVGGTYGKVYGSTGLSGIEFLTSLRRLTCPFQFQSHGNGGYTFNYTDFQTTYNLVETEIDDSYWLMMHIRTEDREGLITPMIGDIADTSTGDYVLRMPLYGTQTLEDISFRTRGAVNTEVRVLPSDN